MPAAGGPHGEQWRVAATAPDTPRSAPCLVSTHPHTQSSNRGLWIGWQICPVCFWEDDGQDDHDADRVRGGPNGRLSLPEARRNFHAPVLRMAGVMPAPTPNPRGTRRAFLAGAAAGPRRHPPGRRGTFTSRKRPRAAPTFPQESVGTH
ncbi:CPCC family cysteine-rich protein [Streptomyces anandii]|uniref:CPCC family cysteine-rich protein n=1 Tax=Streptomyces anandii TaxID=285454 RepID=UPI00227D8A30|nr:CPCC family cysteine-rich protein [Streptomyces anandii]